MVIEKTKLGISFWLSCVFLKYRRGLLERLCNALGIQFGEWKFSLAKMLAANCLLPTLYIK